MTKKLLALLLAMIMLLSFVACRGGDKKDAAASDTSAKETAGETPATDESGTDKTNETKDASGDVPFKIGIYTGTVSQGEEEFQAAQAMKEKYGDMIVTSTYPDNFSTETETVIQGVLQLAADQDVKAIVFCQAVGGAAAAIDKVRETRPDMLFILGVTAEDPLIVSEKADICMLVDELAMGRTIPEEAKRMGAKRLIHYSFPRHMGYPTIAARHQIMMDTCKDIGIEFIDANAPDPTGDAGLSGAQQFMVEDLPKKLQEYGKDTAFFSTNCGLQEPLIRGVWEGGGIYPQQCCPSPYHGYPAALNIDVKGHEGDVQFMLKSIQEKLKEKGQEGRMSTWGVPINMLMVHAGTEYAKEFLEGKITERNDAKALNRIIQDVSAAFKAGEIKIDTFVAKAEGSDEEKNLENFYLLLAPFVDFSQPID